MVPLSGSELTERRDAVALDVTTLIGADEYILARNNRVDPRDPFARQCFAELVQSILFMADIYVPHPTLTTPKPSDFGTRPVLLQQLMAADLLKPLTVSDQGGVTVAEAEELLLSELRRQGRESFRAFLAQVRDIDGMIGAVGARSSKSLAARLHSWCAFQRENVRIPESHGGRVPGDGIEADEFGLWARETSADFADELQWLAGDGEGPFIAATVARGLKYQARAEVAGLSYQPHPLRRDFLVNFTVRSAGADESYALGIAKVVRGVSEGSPAGQGPAARPVFDYTSWLCHFLVDGFGTSMRKEFTVILNG
jgi:hypothetical protein